MSTEQDEQPSASSSTAQGVKGAVRKAVQGAQAAVSSLSTSSPEGQSGAPRTKAEPMSTSTTPSGGPVPPPAPAKKAPAKKAPTKAPGSGPTRPVSIPPQGKIAPAAPGATAGTATADGTPSSAPSPTAQPMAGPRAVPAGAPVPSGAPRRVRLAVSRIDPWSVMKLSFLLSVAVGIMVVVATVAAWTMIDSLGVFASVDQLLREVLGQESADRLNIMQYFAFDRFVSGAVLIAVIDVVLMTALATIGAFLYNVTAALVGGLHLTLTDE